MRTIGLCWPVDVCEDWEREYKLCVGKYENIG